MIIIMLGAPGTGKGSVAELLSKKYNIPAISSGDIFRKYISEGTEIGKVVDSYMSKGDLVPDDIVLKILEETFTAPEVVKNGIILDGFIRTVGQAKAFDKMLEKENKKIDIVVNLETPEDEIVERIVNRRVCTNKDCKAIYNLILQPPKVDGICDRCGSPLETRKDDTEEKIKNRLKVYHKETEPLVKYYEKTGVLYTTTLSKSINRLKEEVVKDIYKYLDEKNNLGVEN